MTQCKCTHADWKYNTNTFVKGVTGWENWKRQREREREKEREKLIWVTDRHYMYNTIYNTNTTSLMCLQSLSENKTGTSAIKCSDQFYLLNHSCHPSCTKFEQFPHAYILFFKIGILVFAAIGLLASTIVILSCLLRCRKE